MALRCVCAVACVVRDCRSPQCFGSRVVVQRSGLFWRNRRLLFEIPIRGPQVLIGAYHAANHRATL